MNPTHWNQCYMNTGPTPIPELSKCDWLYQTIIQYLFYATTQSSNEILGTWLHVHQIYIDTPRPLNILTPMAHRLAHTDHTRTPTHPPPTQAHISTARSTSASFNEKKNCRPWQRLIHPHIKVKLVDLPTIKSVITNTKCRKFNFHTNLFWCIPALENEKKNWI